MGIFQDISFSFLFLPRHFLYIFPGFCETSIHVCNDASMPRISRSQVLTDSFSSSPPLVTSICNRCACGDPGALHAVRPLSFITIVSVTVSQLIFLSSLCYHELVVYRLFYRFSSNQVSFGVYLDNNLILQ